MSASGRFVLHDASRLLAVAILAALAPVVSSAGSDAAPEPAAFAPERPPLIPLPRDITWREAATKLTGASLSLPEGAMDRARADHFRRETAAMLAARGVSLGAGGVALRFELSRDAWFTDKPEGYRLSATREGVRVEAGAAAGLYHGLQTLAQLITRRADGAYLAHAEVRDFPAFPVRGVMNDTGRNHMPTAMLKELADELARYKLNVYHWHFTDNHGWRLESKAHPQVNSPASFDRMPGKCYTQAEFREFVEYCRVRHITVIPELDMPGHTASFRRAFGVESMEDPKVTGILCDLIRELASLAPADVMPYIHLGTDEARGRETVSAATLARYFRTVRECGRRAVCWSPGLQGDPDAIRQTWTNRKRPPAPGVEYIDSQENYLNHLDPFEMVATLHFRKNCPHPSAKGLGGILCSWPDMAMSDPRAHFAQTPQFPALVVYAESLWRDARERDLPEFYSNLPPRGHPEWTVFREFENRLVAHRDLFFRGREFPYVKQSDIVWRLLGPIPHGGNAGADFGVRAGDTRDAYEIGGKTYAWSDEVRTGATVVFKHYTDQPTFANPIWGRQTVAESTYYARTYIHSPADRVVSFWIGAQWWELSNFYAGMNRPGEWHYSKPEFRVNGELVAAPVWAVPNRKPGYHSDGSFIDENYHFRAPTPIRLHRGWNEVLIKSPHVKGARRWMFTFVPVSHAVGAPLAAVREAPDLRFAVAPE